MKRKRRYGISAKMLITTLCMAIIPTALAGLLINNVLYDHLYNTFVSHSASYLEQAAYNLDEKLRSLEMASRMIITDRNLRAVFKSDQYMTEFQIYSPDGMVSTDKHLIMSRFFTNLSVINDNISSMVIMTNADVYYMLRGTDKYDVNFRHEYKNNEWIGQLLRSKGEVSFIGTHYPLHISSPKYQVVSVGRTVFEADGDKYLGTIIIDASAQLFSDVCNTGLLEKNSRLVISDQGGNEVFSFGETNFALDGQESQPAGQQNYYYEKLDGINYIVNRHSSVYSGWQVTYYIPEGNMLTVIYSNTVLVYIAIFSVIILIILGNLFLIRSITRPIVRLNGETKRISQGNFEGRLEPYKTNKNDEIGELYDTFSNMKISLNSTVQRLATTRFKQQEAELLALQSQINPHFIFNTLNVIQLHARMEDKPKIADMLLDLSNIFKNYILKTGQFVTIKEELDSIWPYIKIQNVRYSDSVLCEYEVDDDILRLYCPKFIIQPIVENAIFHGLEPKVGEKRIRITGRKNRETGDIKLIITDNGIGIDDKEIERLNEQINSPDSSLRTGKGIGIKNISDRLKLYFGDKYGVSVASDGKNGSSVTVTLPTVREKK